MNLFKWTVSTCAVLAAVTFTACNDSTSANVTVVAGDNSSSSTSKDSPSSASKDNQSSSSKESSKDYDCSVTDGVKVLYPEDGVKFKMGDTITVIYGSDVKGSGYRFVFKTSEDDIGVDMLPTSAGPKDPDGKTCYEQKVVLQEETDDDDATAEPTDTAIIRVIPYEKTAKGSNSGTFKVTE